jgi:hypothetical protein
MAKDDTKPSTEVDRDFLAWAKEHADRDHEKMEQALADTAHLMRRPRKLQAETMRAWLRSCVAESMQRGFPKDAAVIDIRDKMKVSEKTIWNALLVWRIENNYFRHNSLQSN